MSRDKNGPSITCQVLIYPSTNIFKLNSKSWSHFSNSFNVSTEDMEKYISIYAPKKKIEKALMHPHFYLRILENYLIHS
ncbi:alpha/beta hydrolase [Clostridium botulinum]|nr:alpha/beta hydrolase [Clostridium botulinum]MCS4516529.1 alpha/beta hydrolase [Clostridium botulinum]